MRFAYPKGRIWHPNVCVWTGTVCTYILSGGWYVISGSFLLSRFAVHVFCRTPALTLRTLLLSIRALLSTPEPRYWTNYAAGSQYVRQREIFEVRHPTLIFRTRMFSTGREFFPGVTPYHRQRGRGTKPSRKGDSGNYLSLTRGVEEAI